MMKYSDLTPQEKKLVFLFELALALERDPSQFIPAEQDGREDTHNED